LIIWKWLTFLGHPVYSATSDNCSCSGAFMSQTEHAYSL